MRSRLILRTFLAMSLLSGLAVQLSAKTYTNKTFLAPRAVGINLPMELTTWHEYAYQKLDHKDGHRINGHLAMTPFYQGTDQADDLGKYFAINDKNSFVVGQEGSVFDVYGGNLIHTFGLNEYSYEPAALAGTVSFKPYQEIWGFRFDYFQNFGRPCHGLFVKASMPVVYVKNDIDMSVADSVSETIGGQEFSLKDFFAGKVNVTEEMDDTNLQTGLTHAKIAGERSKFGVADINLALGYKIHQTNTSHVFLSAQIDIPTGPRPRGEYLFQPVIGDGKHFGLGARLDSAIELWHNKHAAIRMLIDLDYHYLFESTEHRTIGVNSFKPSDGSSFALAQYYLVGQIGQQDQPLFPAANILTRGIKVKPGSQFDILADLSFKSGKFVIDLGYNFFYKDEEGCWMKGDWYDDNTYAFAAVSYNTHLPFGETTTDILSPLDKADLDISAIKTPSQVTNKIFAGLGYQFNYSKTVPGLVGLGASYEFAAANSALENYSVWVKLGVSF